jgi:DNA topoisomerase-1
VYADASGRRLRDAASLTRIARLAIPPAWTDVWICPDPDGHLQATGRDVKGRKQYRYHREWNDLRNQTKYGRLLRFGTALGPLRKKTESHLRLQGLPREKVLATVVQLLEKTFIRIGNAEYAKQNRSHGLTTLRDEHVKVSGPKIRFSFKGKSGVAHDIELEDPRLARIVRRCRDLPGYDLFQYADPDGTVRDVGSGDVNGYLRETMAEEFTAKDFRTWAGTVQAAGLLADAGPPDSPGDARSTVVSVIKEVASRLGNRPATCRKYYVHPAIVEAYLDGSLFPEMARCRSRKSRRRAPGGLGCEEEAVLTVLRRASRREPKDLATLLSESVKALPTRAGRSPARRPRRAGRTARRPGAPP